jgi:uncharacterized coiled-coil protein SlyX
MQIKSSEDGTLIEKRFERIEAAVLVGTEASDTYMKGLETSFNDSIKKSDEKVQAEVVGIKKASAEQEKLINDVDKRIAELKMASAEQEKLRNAAETQIAELKKLTDEISRKLDKLDERVKYIQNPELANAAAKLKKQNGKGGK